MHGRFVFGICNAIGISHGADLPGGPKVTRDITQESE